MLARDVLSQGEPLVGRAIERKRLERALDQLDAGAPACVAIEGEAGIGKTRLLRELCARGEDRGFLVLEGRAAEFEREMPFAVVADALDAFVESRGEQLLRRLGPGPRAELAAVLPAARERGAAATSPLGDERFRAHRAVRALLEELASQQSLVIALDDVHWADAASVELIGSLLRRGPDAPVLLALAFRPARVLARLSAALAVPWVRRLELSELDEHEAGELLADVDPAERAAIFREGGGNPFYLEQLARATEPLRPRAAGGDGAAGAPPAVAAAIAEELAALPRAARTMLEAAAVAGEPFEPDLAAEIAELPEREGLAALDELLAVDLVRPTRLPRRFSFRHPLVRRAVYEAAPGGWRLGAHARAAAALGARGAAAAERAHHVEQSARRGDEAAIAVLLEAGHATAARAPDAAAHHFEAALALLPELEGERQVSVRVSLAGALRSLGELGRARDTVLEAIERLSPDQERRRVDLIACCAGVEHWLGRHHDARNRLLRAAASLPEGDSPEAALLQVELAVNAGYDFDFDRAVSTGELALAMANRLADPQLIASAAAALCLCEATDGRIEAAREHRDVAASVIDSLGDAGVRLEALYHLAWADSYLERYDDALAHIDRALTSSRRCCEGRLLVPLMLAQAWPLEMQGRLAETRAICEEALEAAHLSANRRYLFWALWELGIARGWAGDLAGALEAAQESADIAASLEEGVTPSPAGEPGWSLGAMLIRTGQVDRGMDTMLKGVGGVELDHVFPIERCFAWENLAEGELARGRIDAAGEHAARAQDAAGRLGLGVPTAVAARTRAAVLLASGEPLAAAEVAEQGAAAAAAVGARLIAAQAGLLAGRGLAAAGRREAAIALLREVEQELDACTAIRDRDAARRELRRLGARAEPRGPAAAGDSGIPSLTPRELEIAELVTDRKTNRQIAAELFLSDKTVESHLRNIFAKLGVSSRVAVAQAVERERA